VRLTPQVLRALHLELFTRSSKDVNQDKAYVKKNKYGKARIFVKPTRYFLESTLYD
jgi:hypothetical protein